MPSPEVWGPATWTLFHVLAEKINEFAYPSIAGQMFDVIKRICTALPCPECAQDATIFLSKVRIHELRTKNDFKNMIYMFHNYVNAKKRKPLFNYANLEIYKRYNIVSVFNRFISVYHTKGNMRLLAESFQRQIIIKNIREWFSRNICFFIQRRQAPVDVTVSHEEPVISEVINESEIQTIVVEEQPEVVPVEEPEVVPVEEPEVVPVEEPEVVPVEEPEVAPEVAPEVSPEVSPEVAPEVSPEVSPEVAPVEEETEVVESEVPVSESTEEVIATEEEVHVLQEEPLIEEPVKAKRGRKKKTA